MKLRFSLLTSLVVVVLLYPDLGTAGTVTLSDGLLVYTAAPGESNNITIDEPLYTVTDASAPVIAGTGCNSVDAHTAVCDSDTAWVQVLAGDMDDSIKSKAWCWGSSLEGGEGADMLRTGVSDSREYMDGGPGPDVFSGLHDGLAGVVDYSQRTNSVTLTIGDNLANDGEAGEGDLIKGSIWAVRGGQAADTIATSYTIFHWSRFLYGGPGDDSLSADGVVSETVIIGGPGNDLLTTSEPARWTEMYGSRGNDSLRSKGPHSLLHGQAGNDTLSAGNCSRTYASVGPCSNLWGGAGADLMVGGPDADSLTGGDGADTFRARDRVRDELYGGAGRDRARLDSTLDRMKGIEELF